MGLAIPCQHRARSRPEVPPRPDEERDGLYLGTTRACGHDGEHAPGGSACGPPVVGTVAAHGTAPTPPPFSASRPRSHPRLGAHPPVVAFPVVNSNRELAGSRADTPRGSRKRKRTPRRRLGKTRHPSEPTQLA